MRNKLTAAFGLAFAFTFGCLENKGGGGCPNSATVDNIVTCAYQNYKTVQIGKQVWMAENLNFDVPDNDTDMCYNNDPANCAKYGRLYNWATAMALPLRCNNTLSTDDAACAIKTPYHRGICPEGWHIPSIEDWNILITFTGGYIGKLKAKRGWPDYDEDPCYSVQDGLIPGCKGKKIRRSSNGTDNYGFAALPSGGGNEVNWWKADEDQGDATSAYNFFIEAQYSGREYDDTPKNSFASIRCLKDY